MKLIVSADDFGASREVNRAVIRAHVEGVLTSCSLMVTGEAFSEAVQLAREHPRLGVGLHLTTVQGVPVLPPREIPSLLEGGEKFSGNPTRAGLKYFFFRTTRQQLRREIQAQFEKFAGTGLAFSHVDGHLHHHVHPVIFREVVVQARRFRVKAVRIPLDDLPLALKFETAQWYLKLIYGGIFALLGLRHRKRARREGLLYADRVYGFFQSGKMSKDYFLQVVRHLNSPLNEIYFHPADFSSELMPAKKQAELELEALLEPKVKQELQSRGIQLVNYHQLAEDY
jgi:chitin disaccharide deacetylase